MIPACAILRGLFCRSSASFVAEQAGWMLTFKRTTLLCWSTPIRRSVKIIPVFLRHYIWLVGRPLNLFQNKLASSFAKYRL
jgi:hypothetical protein